VTTLTYTPERATPPRKVWVKWVDACVERNDHWIWRDDFEPREEGGLPCETIGFVVHEDERSIVLAQSTGSNGTIDNLITLPKGMVVEIKDLKPYRAKASTS
jgi:hypothetical protein